MEVKSSLSLFLFRLESLFFEPSESWNHIRRKRKVSFCGLLRTFRCTRLNCLVYGQIHESRAELLRVATASLCFKKLTLSLLSFLQTLTMGQSISKRRSLDHVSDSVHVQLKRERKIAIQHGKHPPCGFVERTPLPSLRVSSSSRRVVCCEEEEDDNDIFGPMVENSNNVKQWDERKEPEGEFHQCCKLHNVSTSPIILSQ